MTDERTFWLAIRQALLIVLGAIEERLGLERSVTPKRKRRAMSMDAEDNTKVRELLDITTVGDDHQKFLEVGRGVQGTCIDCMRGDCEKARQGIEHT